MIVQNRSGYVSGQGATGKSTVIKGDTEIKGLVRAFKDAGYTHTDKKGEVHSRVFCLGFTHVAAQNLEVGHMILHFLHRHANSKRIVVICDEAGLVPENCWTLLAALKWTGNIVVVLGDCEGQLTSIADQHLSPQGVPQEPVDARPLQRALH